MFIKKILLQTAQRVTNSMFWKLNPLKNLNSQKQKINFFMLDMMILKYYENALILIANEAERVQFSVKFTVKEELTLTVIILLLTVSHAVTPD